MRTTQTTVKEEQANETREMCSPMDSVMEMEEVEDAKLLTECDMNTISVKQEDIGFKFEDYEVSSDIKIEEQQEDGVELEDSNEDDTTTKLINCRLCNMKFDDCNYYTIHVNQIHGIDFDPPNVYCKRCDKQYSSHRKLRSHIRSIHKIYMPRLILNKKPNPDILPDPNDPDFYCRSCVHYYKTKGIFHRHCRDIHNMNIPMTGLPKPRPNESIEPDPNDPNFYCKSCNRTYSCKKALVRHLRNIHDK